MKQPNFKRKALCMLIAPFALGALPVSAATLDVNPYYNGYSEFYYGTDEQGNTFVFYIPNYDECTFVGIESPNNTATLPETVRISMNDGYMNPETGEEIAPNYEEVVVRGFNLNCGWNHIVNPLGNANELTDITLTDNISSFEYRLQTDHAPINIHFTSEIVPYVYIDGFALDADGLNSHCPISVPASAIEAYNEALRDYSYYTMIIPEGTDPKTAFEAEIAALKGLRIVYNSDCVPYASWSATDGNGTLLAFESPYSDITFRGAITTEKSINVPELVYVAEPEWYAYRTIPVTRFCLDYYNEDNNGFPGSTNLTDIYLPSHLTYAEFHGEGFDSRMNFHFSSEMVPEFCFYDSSNNYVNIYVPDELFMTYAEALGSEDYVLWSETPATPVNVNVATPGTLAEQISAVTGDLSNVRWLVVTGTPNDIDLRMIRRLPRLEKLDLSATTGLTSVGGCNGLRYLSEVLLPNGIKSIDNSAFYDCRRLQAIQLPKSVTKIGSSAFEYTGVTSANLENVEEIGNGAFRCTKLTEASLDAAIEIGSEAFESSRIKNLAFGPNITRIGSYAFNDNRLSGTMEIPARVTVVENGIFENNPDITKFIIHNNVTHIGSNSFRSSGSKLESIECKVLFPTDYNGCSDMDLSKVTLYVPALTINEYLLHDNWLNFTNVEPLPYDLTDLEIDRDFTISSDKGVADKANIDLKEYGRDPGSDGGHLTINRNKVLNLGDFNMSGYYDGEYYDPNYGWRYGAYYRGATVIPESAVTADNVNINLRLRTDKWTFLSFPFDINVKDIVVDEDALWVVRKYSGEARANLEENTWQNMSDGTVLKAGEGYIFNCATEGRSEVNFKFQPAAGGNAFFANDVVAKTLASYPSEFAHNASWNLAGNTFPAYLNLKGIDFDAPLTLWQDGSYYAYSPIDDDLVLEPFQAFFVQAQAVGDVIKLNPVARAHSREAAAELDFAPLAARAPRANAMRSLFNIHVSGETGADRTRIVVNEEASTAYESNRDASKFMSSDELVPQIFVNNSNVRMAINEAPLGNGEFTLGARFGKKGQYTISLDTRNAEEYSALLIDNVTGETTDLTESDYVFDADASINEARFTLALASTNAVATAVAEGLEINVTGNVLSIRSNAAVEISVASIDGKAVASGRSADFSTILENGIYIVKAGEKTMKVKVGK
ncbi:MAG: leucine-rich repeat domain-containing protein [Muribaculaceae bacterium]|nr:leucine-rich repeat domain-containing protein [Muribaculaceae bacterium]